MGIRTEVFFHTPKVPTLVHFAENLQIALKKKNWANFGPFLKSGYSFLELFDDFMSHIIR